MNYVFLVYEDDYGSTFSPYVLTKVFPEDKEADAVAYVKEKGWLARLFKSEFNGLSLQNYPQYNGGLFSDD